MMSGRNIFKITKGRAARVLVVLLLLYVGVDFIFPQMCSEEVAGAPAQAAVLTPYGNSAESISSTIVIEQADNSRQDQPQEKSHQEEDCFCCCAHILPGVKFSGATGLELTTLRLLPVSESISTPPLHSLYRPPRLA